MNINIEYDVFISFPDSSGSIGALKQAKELYEYLEDNGIRCFLFSEDSSTNFYKANFMKIMQSRLMILVCNDRLERTRTGEIDNKKNYHLYVELDTFYAMTQAEELYRNLNDAMVLYYSSEGNSKLKSSPESIHPLFNNRNSFVVVDENDEFSKEDAYEDLLDWIQDRLDHYDSDDASNELVAVFNRRGSDLLSSTIEGINFKKVLRKAKTIKCVGISNWTFSLNDGCKKLLSGLKKDTCFEMLYLDPEGEFVELRAKEEKKDTREQIKTSFDMMRSQLESVLNKSPEKMQQLKLYTFDLVPRDNLIMVYTEEADYIFVQNYSHAMPGSSCPCTIFKRTPGKESQIFDYYESVYQNILDDEKTREYVLI